MTVEFSPHDEFTADAVRRLSWESRLARYHQLWLELKYLREQDTDGEPEGESPAFIPLALDFLALLGLVEETQGSASRRWQLTETTRQMLLEGFEKYSNADDYDGDVTQAVLTAAVEVLLNAAGQFGVGLTMSLLSLGSEGLLRLAGLAKILADAEGA